MTSCSWSQNRRSGADHYFISASRYQDTFKEHLTADLHRASNFLVAAAVSTRGRAGLRSEAPVPTVSAAAWQRRALGLEIEQQRRAAALSGTRSSKC